MRSAVTLLAIVPLLLIPLESQAQSRWSVEASGDVAVPTQDLGMADLGTGLGFGANVRYRFLPHLAAYAGWEWHHFTTDDAGALPELDVEDTGYTFGLRFEHPLSADRATAAGPTVWVRGGGLVNHIELEDDAGAPAGDTSHGLGWEAGAGVTVPLGAKVSLAPGFRYRSLARELTAGGTAEDVALAYVAAGLGVVIGF